MQIATKPISVADLSTQVVKFSKAKSTNLYDAIDITSGTLKLLINKFKSNYWTVFIRYLLAGNKYYTVDDSLSLKK